MLAQVRGVHIWLRVIARVNLLTKLRRCSRGHMIVGGESVHGY